jgi:hypothetical protein
VKELFNFAATCVIYPLYVSTCIVIEVGAVLKRKIEEVMK